MRKLLTLVLALGLLTTPVMAAESSALGGEGDAVVVNTDAAQPAPIPAWAYKELADGYAMGLFGDEIYTEHNKTVTQEQLAALTKTVADKLALLGVEQRSSAGSFVLDTTRGGVLNALYMEALPYAFPGVDAGPVDFMRSMKVVRGDNTGLALDRPCTLMEAASFANRLILNLYDQQNAGSLGGRRRGTAIPCTCWAPSTPTAATSTPSTSSSGISSPAPSWPPLSWTSTARRGSTSLPPCRSTPTAPL